MTPATQPDQAKKVSSSGLRRVSRQKPPQSSNATPISDGKAFVRHQKRKRRPFNIAKIVVPVDFSRASQAAIGYAVSFANLFGARLILTHVIGRIYYGDEFSYVQVNTQEMRRQIIKDLRKLKMRLPPALKVEMKVRQGSAFHEIVAVAKETQADLIVMATHGHTGLKHVFLGSTAERVVQHASCPVLVVPSGMGRKAFRK
jgi:universal stress protein A